MRPGHRVWSVEMVRKGSLANVDSRAMLGPLERKASKAPLATRDRGAFKERSDRRGILEFREPKDLSASVVFKVTPGLSGLRVMSGRLACRGFRENVDSKDLLVRSEVSGHKVFRDSSGR